MVSASLWTVLKVTALTVPPDMASKHSHHWVKTLVFTNGLIPSVLIITSIPLVSGMDSSEFHLGWPFDGCATLYKSSFLSHILHLTPSNFQACIQAFCSVLLHDWCMWHIYSLHYFSSSHDSSVAWSVWRPSHDSSVAWSVWCPPYDSSVARSVWQYLTTMILSYHIMTATILITFLLQVTFVWQCLNLQCLHNFGWS